MGKGFNNYMCKKFFHPASRDNLKRVWMAEQQTEAYKKKQEELRVQYEKEQDLYTNKAIMSKESKEKLSVNFLYEPPPGTKKDREREDDEPEFKFEWQRKYNAPRESYCKGDQEIRDQPFGIQVRNVRCIKCHKWGHINTDKECPMYNQSAGGAETGSSLNPSDLIRQMREDGLAMKKGAVGLLELPSGPSNVGNQQLIPSSSEDEDHMNESELKFLEGLSTKKKLKLLRKLEKMEKKKKKKKSKKELKKSGKNKKGDSDSESCGSEIESSKLKKKSKKKLENGGDWVKKSHEMTDHTSTHLTENKKNGDNDLYSVLGRKMDFEGAPRSQVSEKRPGASKGSASKESYRRSRSTSSSRNRSRSRSPMKMKDKNGQRRSEGTTNYRGRVPEGEEESRYASESRRRHHRTYQDRARSTSRERSKNDSRYQSSSTSRDHHRRSRSPSGRDSGSKIYGSSKRH